MPTYTIQGKNTVVTKLLADSQTDSLIIPNYKDDKMFKEMQRAFCQEGRRAISSNCYDRRLVYFSYSEAPQPKGRWRKCAMVNPALTTIHALV